MMGSGQDTKQSFDIFLHRPRCVGTKKQLRFISVDLLTHSKFYMAKMSIIVLQSVRFAFARGKLSSAKNRCDTLGLELRRETPLSAPEFSACCIKECRPFAHKRNK